MLGISNETPKEAVTPVVPPVQVTPEEPVVPASTIANEPKTLDIPVPPQVEKKMIILMFMPKIRMISLI